MESTISLEFGASKYMEKEMRCDRHFLNLWFLSEVVDFDNFSLKQFCSRLTLPLTVVEF